MDKIIHLSVSLNCSATSAFEMFTKKELVESWLTEVAEIEPRVGGKYELFWEPNKREINSTIGCQITAFEKDKFLSFEWKSPIQFNDFANTADPLTHCVVFFIPSLNKTEVHLVHSGWRQSQNWENARQWQETAWKIALDQLTTKL